MKNLELSRRDFFKFGAAATLFAAGCAPSEAKPVQKIAQNTPDEECASDAYIVSTEMQGKVIFNQNSSVEAFKSPVSVADENVQVFRNVDIALESNGNLPAGISCLTE